MKEAIEIQKGDVVDFTLDSDVSVGDVVAKNDLVGVATVSGLTGETIGLAISGVWEIKAKNADAVEFGKKLYFDSTNRELTTTADSNTKAGIAVSKKAANTDGAVLVKLNIG